MPGERSVGGAVYLLQPPNCSNVFKVGMTNRNDGARVASYGKNSTILRVVECDNPSEVESRLLIRFDENFTRAYKKEYFQGDQDAMIKVFDTSVLECAQAVPKGESLDIEGTLEKIRMETNAHQISVLSDSLYDAIGLPQCIRARLEKLSHLNGFAIDAGVEMKFFGVLADRAFSDKVRRCLVRQDLLSPKPPEYDTKFQGVIEQSPYCRVVRAKLLKSGRHYDTIVYWITWAALVKLLTRASCGRDYAVYFAIKAQITSSSQIGKTR